MLCCAALVACAGAPDDVPGGRLAIDVAPLSLTGVADATYTLRVVNGLDQEVWVKTVTSTQHGDGAGAVSHVGPCDGDPAAQPNRIELVVDGLEDASGALTEGVDWANPAPAGSPLVLEATCDPDRDVPITFDIAIARAARQGFFDVAVELVDVFCSAKLDCESDSGQPIQLLFNAAGQRDDTAVMALACTGGPGSTTELYMSDLVVTCGGDTVTINPSLGPGKLSVDPTSGLPDANGHIFDALVTSGSEQLGNYDKKYWNVALGLADVAGCTLSAAATASDGALPDGATPVGTTWPVIHWAGDFDSCTRHGLDSGDGVVTTQYTGFAGETFPYFANAAGIGRFQVLITGALTQGDAGMWDDGTYATSCYDYRYPTEPYTYAGSTGDGWYRVDPDGAGPIAPYEVYCDQTTASGGVDGGWTLLVDWNREDSTADTWATLRAKMIEEINNMGEQQDRATYIEWSDWNSPTRDVLSYRVDAVPNGGEIRATIHAQGVSDEDSGILFFTRMAAGGDVNVVCNEDATTGGLWGTWDASEQAYYPSYTCPNHAANFTWNTTYVLDQGGDIDSFYFVSFQADGSGGDSSYLFKLIVYVR